MRFPKQELNIDEYFEKIKQLLVDPHCHIFIDTNIISQLYRLNEDARIDFYNWVNTCSSRFHIPNWSVHEYSKRVTTQNTKDYLSELTKAKTFSKELKNIGKFLKAYVGDSLLIGSIYDGKMQELFNDMDNVSSKFEKIANVINNGLSQHQLNVHKEVLDKLETYILDSNMYFTLENLAFEADLRFDGKVPPGFKDSDKESNRIGDLVIWKEILEFCKANIPEVEKIKAVFISRDIKPDMVYRPIKQIKNGFPVNKEEDKVEIANESLVGEFKLTTGSDEYYLISFYTLVQILAPQRRNLAVSFQIATEPENLSAETQVTDIINHEIEPSELTNVEIVEVVLGTLEETIPEEAVPIETYSVYALEDEKYDTSRGRYVQSINQVIEELKSYNWYRQNPAIERLSTFSLENNGGNSQQFKDLFFVLGRNILQSAVGSSGSAIQFVESLHFYIKNWKMPIKRSLIDGLLFEIFFDSKGKIRKKGFKADYINEIVNSVNHVGLDVPFGFINTQLSNKNEGRFVPEVGSDKKYKFEFGFTPEPNGLFPEDVKTSFLKIDDVDVSDTFKVEYDYYFSSCDNLNYSLSIYYGIPTENIEIELIDEKIKAVSFIKEYEF